MRTMNQTVYPFEVRILMNNGKATLTRAKCRNLFELIDNYRFQCERYSRVDVTPFPVKISETEPGRIEAGQIREIVWGVEARMSNNEILECIKNEDLDRKIERHYIN